MNSPAHSDRPPTYQQVLSTSQEQLHQHNAPYNTPKPSVPIVQPTVVTFSNQPVTMSCPYCGYTITTIIEEENGAMVYMLCILFVLFGLICGCCLIPFCVSELKDKIHFCPKCQKSVGKKALL